MKPFVVNSHRRLVFPSNFFPEPDFSSIDTVDELAAIVRRDFEAKAPTGSQIAARAESGGYANRYELLRDLGLHLFWMNRYVITMYEKRPTRWRDVPRRRDDIFLPALTPWEDGERKVAAVESCYRRLPAAWSAEVEDDLYGMLFRRVSPQAAPRDRPAGDQADGGRGRRRRLPARLPARGVRTGPSPVQAWTTSSTATRACLNSKPCGAGR